MEKHFLIGMDVGSTTVKAVVQDAATDEILWSDYQRHDTKQPEKVLEFCKRFDTEIEGFDAKRSRMFITGSGGNGLGKHLGAKFVQEVNAVSLAVEKLYPGMRLGDRVGRPGRQDHHLQDRPRNGAQEENSVDER
jgi:activator of 2-hydroxyglutaryl-CoA dehydratase